MPSRRGLKHDEYDIGVYAYRELHNFCLQYDSKIQQLADIRSPYNSPQITGMSHRSSTSSQTASSAERAAILSSDYEMIEQAAIEVNAEDYQCIILAVTNDAPWHYLKMVENLKTPRDKFNEERKLFTICLQRKEK